MPLRDLIAKVGAAQTVLISAVALFALLAICVVTGAAEIIDGAVRDAIHGIANPALTAFARTVTMLGSTIVLVTLCAAAAAVFLFFRRPAETITLIAVLAVTMLTNSLLKIIFQRSRPEAYYGDTLSTFSFPSGHSAFACAFYGALTLLVASHISHRWRVALVSGLCVLVGAIGASRIYLGVHYPTDVAGGYLVAIACVALVWALPQWRKRHGIGRSGEI